MDNFQIGLEVNAHCPSPELMRRIMSDGIKYGVHWKVEKYEGREQDNNLAALPYETVEGFSNLLVNSGINEMLELITGTGSTVAFNNANAHIGVGSGSTAAAATDTTLQTELDRKPMQATYPQVAAQTATFLASFNDPASDGVWNEWGIFNASSGGVMMNHKIASLGTKAGGTWNLTVTISLS